MKILDWSLITWTMSESSPRCALIQGTQATGDRMTKRHLIAVEIPSMSSLSRSSSARISSKLMRSFSGTVNSWNLKRIILKSREAFSVTYVGGSALIFELIIEATSISSCMLSWIFECFCSFFINAPRSDKPVTEVAAIDISSASSSISESSSDFVDAFSWSFAEAKENDPKNCWILIFSFVRTC